ncbi:MAG: hypothetical protein A2931_02840 [Candidatus Niyogibacteria bacterium RIFCSPLOWO2_01_FULL_45_48]|uniref:Capsule polysaccharide biosynthesis protein n=2 Tax=Candidatus Niyogiibacteriota TaxID=1817912 RepID=A0A1G2F0X1_9BACT|nr:MAG: hypothetical protein A2835_03165 [Candidatus Niyogibacteria bacterium RIFCSPHIGHO2_01_FULL_45_28]OGZ31085.1 MAG: hypothetical protein A2931_02840 [Candidatus Niyogibacteria bacterium RIFCSPLOWO2_01_FULL_45_48]OGZ31412.1 MAG: hypothetical protein A3J00_02185 [Candidatus Niyogibacteria bacterium RIFCSPLOWO2_02_FULL_45_13]
MTSRETKICLFLQRRFAPIGHTMAVILNKKYGVEQFCGYVSMRSNLELLKSSKNPRYTKLILDEDIYKFYKTESVDLNYLNLLEKEYGIPNLWPFVDSDRIVRHGLFLREYPYDFPLHSHEDMLKLTQVYAKAAIQFLEEEKPDVIIFPVIEGLTTLLLYHIAQKKGIKTLFIQTSRVGNKYTITEQYDDLSYVRQTFEKLNKGDASCPEYRKLAQKFLADFRDKPASHEPTDVPSQRPITRKQQFAFLSPRKIGTSIFWIIKIFIDYLQDAFRDDHTKIKPWHHVFDRTKRKIRVLVGFEDLYDEADKNEDFAFYPLQKEPEISITLFAPFFKDQLWLTRQIARSLPIHYKLYVKEHPSMFSYRPRKYYKELKKIPNVKLIRPSVSSFDLTKNAKLIATITGTAGWEGILLKKPVITLGDVFYSALPMVKNCKTIEELPYIVKTQLENFNYDEEKLINLITAIYRESAPLDLSQIWDIEGGSQAEKKEEEIMPIVDLIAEKLNLKAI